MINGVPWPHWVSGHSRALLHTPGWYYNLRADPVIQVTYQGKSTAAVAREVHGEEWQAIWERARHIYGGYEAYARRIKGRPIRIMLLSTQVTSASDTG